MNIDITPTAPLHAGKRGSNFPYLNQFHTPFQVKQIKDGISTPISTKKLSIPSKVPLPTTPPTRNPDFIPFESANLQREITNLNDPEAIKLRFSIAFFNLSLIFLTIFLLGFHPEIFLLLSILFFSLAAYSVSKYIKKLIAKEKTKDINEDKQKHTPGQILRNKGKRPSEMFARYGSTDQYNSLNHDTDVSVDMYHQFINADRPSASLIKVSTISRTTEAQIDILAGETLKKLNLKLSIFHQYCSKLKNFIAKDILSKIETTSNKPYYEMMQSVPGYDPKYVNDRIRELSNSPYLAGHLAEKGDNQIVLHILSVWLSYLMTNSRDDKRPPLVFAQKYVSIGAEPKIESNENVYLICNNEYNSFYVIARPLNENDSTDSSTVERFYAYPGKDAMYSGLTIFFLIIKMKFNLLLDGADLQEPPFCMDKIFDLTSII